MGLGPDGTLHASGGRSPDPLPPAPLLQLRIGAIVRRDSEPEHPHFPGGWRLLETACASCAVCGAAIHRHRGLLQPAAAPAQPTCAVLHQPPAGKKAHPASLVGAKAVEMAAGGASDAIERLYLD